MPVERTLVIVKPDGVRRNLVGEIVRRFESAGLRLRALKMIQAQHDVLKNHYPEEEEYLVSLGKKSEAAGDKIDNYRDQGMMIVRGLREYLSEGPVVVMIIEGWEAIQKVRQIAGYTDPLTADKGTIRGDFGEDSILKANGEKRSVRNLLHASGNQKEAENEISLWFLPDEIL